MLNHPLLGPSIIAKFSDGWFCLITMPPGPNGYSIYCSPFREGIEVLIQQIKAKILKRRETIIKLKGIEEEII